MSYNTFNNFPYANLQDINLDWILEKVKEVIDLSNLTAQQQADLKDYVDNYFANLDPDATITQIINDMAADGRLAAIVDPAAAVIVSAWLQDNITNPSNPPIDTSLSVAGAAADAKVVGDRFLAQDANIQSVDIKLTPESNLLYLIDEPGAIYSASGADNDSASALTAYQRSGYLYMPKGARLKYLNLRATTTLCMMAVYDIDKTYDVSYSRAGQSAFRSLTFTMPYDGYIRLSTSNTYRNDAEIYLDRNKPLNILALGNSFTQDVFAYLPPVLNELLPDRDITYCVCYTGSADIQTQIDTIDNDDVYTWVNVWYPHSKAWTRYAGGGGSEKHFSDAIAMADNWDIVYVQPASGVTDAATFRTNVTDKVHDIMRRLQRILNKPFSLVVGTWLATTNTVFTDMRDRMAELKDEAGLVDIWPIGTAIQNARTNSTLQALGDSGNMLFDSQHQQSGLPAILSTYVIAQSILKMIGRTDQSILGSSWVPTDANAIAINAYKSAGWTSPYPMTHGWSVGLDADDLNRKAAQEIAMLAVNNPDNITDCSGLIVGDGINTP